jgi:hypothetical protein
MKKILLVSKQLSYPLIKGGSIAQYYFIDGLKNDIEFILCLQISDKKQLKDVATLKAKLPNLKIYLYLKQPNIEKTILRIIKSVIKLLLAFFGKYRSISSDFTTTMSAPQDKKFIDLLNEIIQKENIRQIQFDFYETIDLSYAVPQGIRKIFIHHELRFKRFQLEYDKSQHLDYYKNFIINKTEAIEKTFLENMDIVVVFNDVDADLIKNNCKQLVVSPFGIPDELIYKDRVSQTFSRFVFIGTEKHNPNTLGLSWFLDTVFIPNIDSISLPVLIIGNWSAVYRKKYKHYPKIVFCGVVDSIESYFEESVLINSILTGSGIRTKVLHAFVNKVPVISTQFGAEGCYTSEQQNHLMFFDSSDEFQNIMNQITDDKWAQLGQSGFDYYNEQFDKTKLLTKRMEIYI